MKIFVLEDQIDYEPRSAILKVLNGHEVDVARSFEAAKAIYNGNYNLLLLDCDMRGIWGDHDHYNSGLRFCEWLINHNPTPRPRVVLHSQNFIGRAKMKELLDGSGFSSVEFPFTNNYPDFLHRLVLQF